ncbi:FG-GAP-like repeat-containing protein [Kitasatospora azatica]|uniref:FG-GAP-like repeat-containing protein n=1 Tax=Kitasatospora azatica TaxID=58347 RepID=UPI0018DE7472|nr:FG-GAP-like repeat-containing protein [Kitasatospora azatica]
MKRLIPLTVAALIGAAAGAPVLGGGAAAAATTPPVLRVMPLGDSITMGAYSESGGGYRLPLWNQVAGQSRYSMDFVGSQLNGPGPDADHEGHSGWRINDIAGGVDSWLGLQRPDVVLLHIGINDLNRGADPVQAEAQLKTLVERIFADRPGIAVVLQGLIPTTANLQTQVQQYNDLARQLPAVEQQAGRHLSFLDAPALTSDQFHDSLHPNDAGYARMAQTYFTGLDQAFSDGWVPGNSPNPGSAPEVSSRVRWADWDGDGKADYLVVNDDGSVEVYLNKGGDTPGHPGWQYAGKVATGLDRDRSRVRFADFDGDGKADYIFVNPDGSVHVFLNRGGDTGGGWQDLGQVATGLTNNADRVRFADFTRDGKADYILLNDDGSVDVFQNNGGDGHGGWQNLGQVATGQTGDRTRVRFADFDGDGRADYTVINPDGSVHVFLNRGGDTGGGWQNLGQVATGQTSDQNQVRLADFDGDRKADYLQVTPTGAVNLFLNHGGDGGGGWLGLGQVATGTVSEQ